MYLSANLNISVLKYQGCYTTRTIIFKLIMVLCKGRLPTLEEVRTAIQRPKKYKSSASDG